MIPRRTLSLALCAAASLLAAHAASAQPAEGGLPYRTGFEVKSDPALAAKVPQRYRQAGTLTVATNPNTPPTVYITEDNRTLAGREIDVMSAVAHRLGLEPRWVNAGSFGNIVPGLSSGRYDAALANLSVTPDRLKQVDFVSYFDNNRLGLVRAKDGFDGKPATDLMSLCGETIGAGSGTTNAEVVLRQSEACVAAGRKPITVPLFPGRPAGVQAVLSGRIPGFVGPYEGLVYMVSASQDRLALAGIFTVPGDFVGIGLQKDSPLTPVVAEALNSLIQDGTYSAILKKWDLDYGALPEARQNGAILEAPRKAASGG
ncbi:ABC transporter substrate-binding protein [Roseomonas gilardii]|uniref:ABC transporter substrate-binding protein n=1 Tax=Roseomonas gilardii TaxID=257708 RepID=A0ABU3MIK6_9PROT|nr:ABC transporter substrate-binding protein [Roseomonas gilardii]MDT8332843.1 ABC transporter substrate-binding protein [Roseomonas gilardii]